MSGQAASELFRMAIAWKGHFTAQSLQPVHWSALCSVANFFHRTTSRLSRWRSHAATHHPQPVQRAVSTAGSQPGRAGRADRRSGTAGSAASLLVMGARTSRPDAGARERVLSLKARKPSPFTCPSPAWHSDGRSRSTPGILARRGCQLPSRALPNRHSRSCHPNQIRCWARRASRSGRPMEA